MHTSSVWHPILLVFNNVERSSMYTANTDGDNIPPYRTLLEIVKIWQNFSFPPNT